MQYEIGQYYHVYNRGNNKQTIFYEEENYHYLIKLFRKNAERFRISVIAYCLMPNHYHLLLRQDDDIPLSQFTSSTFQSYTQAFNARYNRSGKLFENSRDPIFIDTQAYLFQVCQYIHRNPLEAGLVKVPAAWSYSNYPEYIGDRKGTLFPRDLVTEWFASLGEYRPFVEEEFEDGDYDDIGPYLFE